MDKGWKAAGQRVSGSASQQVSKSAGQHETGVPQVSSLRPGSEGPPKPPQQVLEGYVKNGVVHLLNGELPEGTRVKVTRE